MSDEAYVVLGSVSGLGMIFIIIISYIFAKSKVNYPPIEFSRWLLFYSYLGLISFCLSCLLFTFMCLYYNKLNGSPNFGFQITIGIWALIWDIGQICTYLLFLDKFYNAIKNNNKYATPKSIYNIIFIMIVIYLMFAILVMPLVFYKNDDIIDRNNIKFINVTNKDDNLILYLVYVFGVDICNLVISISLLILFFKKLTQVTIYLSDPYAYDDMNGNNNIKFNRINDTNNNSNSNGNNIINGSNNIDSDNINRPKPTKKSVELIENENDDDEPQQQVRVSIGSNLTNLERVRPLTIDETISDIQDNRNETLFDIMSKVFTLSCSMLIITQIVLIQQITNNIIVIFYPDYWNQNQTRIDDYIYYISRTIHCCVLSLCIILSFKFTEDYYMKFCGYYHNKMKKICIKATRTRIIKESEQSYHLLN